MANTIDWGKATQNNTNGFGKYQNTINAGDIYANSWAGETVIVGTSAAFSYSKSSYHQGEADPTPTITGTTGGSFVCTSGAVFVDTGSTSSSTGQIDLDASTLNTHLISYTVDGVTATANVGVTASPFIANTYSMQFDAVDDYINLGSSFYQVGSGNVSLSIWIKPESQSGNNDIFAIGSNTGSRIRLQRRGNNFGAYINNSSGAGSALTGSSTITNGVWYNLMLIKSGTTFTLYVNGTSETSGTYTGTFDEQEGIIGAYFGGSSGFIKGKLDEAALWNTALSADAVTEIYNATNNNSGKALDLSTDSGNYSSSSNLQYWNRMGD